MTNEPLRLRSVIHLIVQENVSSTSPDLSKSHISADGGQEVGGTISALNMTTNKLDWQVDDPTGAKCPRTGPAVQNGSCYER